MSINDKYIRYLEHFGRTATLGDMHEDKDAKDIICLRHDIDHDLDIALDMALEEQKRGIKATYFLLHTAPYWKDALFIDKCLELQGLGHEAGLHLNIISEWFRGNIDDIDKSLEDILRPLLNRGVRITGVSAHGDRLCYEKGFINHWCFLELRPDNPEESESGLNAEGIKAYDRLSAIKYPSNHTIKRADGRELRLWSVPMKMLGLEYLASRIPFDSYFSDSGGGWSRTSDPMEHDLSRGRHQVLIHPIHWQGRQRIYFFLSPNADAAGVINGLLKTATPLKVRSDYLSGNKKLTLRSVVKLRASIDEQNGDYAESGVFCEDNARVLRSVFPEAAFFPVDNTIGHSGAAAKGKISIGEMLSDASNPHKTLVANKIPAFPGLSRLWWEWMRLRPIGDPAEVKETAARIIASPDFPSLPDAGRRGIIGSHLVGDAPTPEFTADFAGCSDIGFTLKGMRIGGEFLTIKPEGRGDSHIVLGGGYWKCLPPSLGWRSGIGEYYDGKLGYELRGSGVGNLFLLSYCPLGRLISARLLGRLYRGARTIVFSFKVRADAPRFCLAVKIPYNGRPEAIILKKLSLGKAG